MNLTNMWKYAINGVRIVMCAVIAWEIRNSPIVPIIIYLSLIVIGLMLTKKIYERS
tara:strand:- start:467 stop:634 length:168 start_codon:yes stop_codon:yes gene_type:complete